MHSVNANSAAARARGDFAAGRLKRNGPPVWYWSCFLLFHGEETHRRAACVHQEVAADAGPGAEAGAQAPEGVAKWLKSNTNLYDMITRGFLRRREPGRASLKVRCKSNLCDRRRHDVQPGIPADGGGEAIWRDESLCVSPCAAESRPGTPLLCDLWHHAVWYVSSAPEKIGIAGSCFADEGLPDPTYSVTDRKKESWVSLPPHWKVWPE